MEFVKFIEGLPSLSMADEEEKESYLESGFLPIIEESEKEECGEFETLECSYIETDEGYKREWKKVIDKDAVNMKIQQLKQELSSTDYVIVKQMEATLLGDDLPYGKDYIAKIAQSRKSLRMQINEYEKNSL